MFNIRLGDKGRYSDEFLEATRKVCECGHTIHFTSRAPYIECSHCHKIMFKNKKAEFDYKIKRKFTNCKRSNM